MSFNTCFTPGLGVELDSEPCSIPIGKGEIVRHGENMAILAVGAMVAPALEAAQELASNGIEATVVNARFIKPLDSELVINLAKHIKRMVTVEENVLNGSFGSSVIRLLQESGMNNIQVKSIGLPDEFVEQGAQSVIRSKYGLDAKGIAQQVLILFPHHDSNSLLKVKGEVGATPTLI